VSSFPTNSKRAIPRLKVIGWKQFSRETHGCTEVCWPSFLPRKWQLCLLQGRNHACNGEWWFSPRI